MDRKERSLSGKGLKATRKVNFRLDDDITTLLAASTNLMTSKRSAPEHSFSQALLEDERVTDQALELYHKAK